MNSYADLNEIVRIDLESLPFMDSDLFDLPIPPRITVATEFVEASEKVVEERTPAKPKMSGSKHYKTIRELLQADRKVDYSRSALFEIFDVMDIMNHSLRQAKNKDQEHLQFNISRISEIAHDVLRQYGIIELDVLGKSFDERTMEVLATVERRDYEREHPGTYRSKQVVIVHQRGFAFHDDAELIRKAKVTIIR